MLLWAARHVKAFPLGAVRRRPHMPPASGNAGRDVRHRRDGQRRLGPRPTASATGRGGTASAGSPGWFGSRRPPSTRSAPSAREPRRGSTAASSATPSATGPSEGAASWETPPRRRDRGRRQRAGTYAAGRLTGDHGLRMLRLAVAPPAPLVGWPFPPLWESPGPSAHAPRESVGGLATIRSALVPPLPRCRRAGRGRVRDRNAHSS